MTVCITEMEDKMYEEIVEEIIAGRRLHKGDDVSFLLTGSLEDLKRGANHIREALCGNRVDLCTIINGRAGKCSTTDIRMKASLCQRK